MSSRRGAGEENILAMLERDSARRAGSRMSGVRLASYGAAAALVGILAGGVAWLAYDNHQGVQELQAHTEAVGTVAPATMPDADLPPPAPPAAIPAPPADVPSTAVIVDESARQRDTTVASSVPPLVMLPPSELAGAKPAPAPRAVQENAAVEAPRPEPAKVAARSTVEKKPTKASKPARRPVKPAPARTLVQTRSKARTEEGARARKATSGTEAPVDTDVALISAIIQHSERHRGEREATANCAGGKCPAKPGRP